MNAVRAAKRASVTWRTGLGLIAWLVVGGTACSLDGLLNSDELPPDVSDPAISETPNGARAAYYGTLALFREAFNGFIPQSGFLGDELRTGPGLSEGFRVDRRAMIEGGSEPDKQYSSLQKVRGQSGQAIGLLRDYLPDSMPLRGHLYAIQGYAELFLAELFCSGVPLGTLDYHGDFTYRPGSTTEQVLSHAITLFDTTLALAGDSARFMQLAQLGLGRAWLGLGDYAAAAAAVATVADDFRYEVFYNNVTGTGEAPNFFKLGGNGRWGLYDVPDREGINGLDWRTSEDPRTPIVQRADTNGNNPFYFPSNFATDGSSPLVLASGVEARLIEAEAQLAAGNAAWLATLNALRTDGTFEIADSQAVTDTMVDSTVTPPDTTVDTTGWTYDTLWHAGSGGVDGLAPLADPGTEAGRVDLLFRERAFWLFLTGHRQGDLRRLIRQYGRFQSDVYPVGLYGVGPFSYGPDVTAPIPATEFANPLYTGCISRNA